MVRNTAGRPAVMEMESNASTAAVPGLSWEHIVPRVAHQRTLPTRDRIQAYTTRYGHAEPATPGRAQRDCTIFTMNCIPMKAHQTSSSFLKEIPEDHLLLPPVAMEHRDSNCGGKLGTLTWICVSDSVMSGRIPDRECKLEMLRKL